MMYLVSWTKDGRTFTTKLQSADDAKNLAATYKKMGYAVNIETVKATYH